MANDKYISLESLKEYNKQMKEEYIKPLEDNKLDKTGGSISGIVNIEGALTLPNSPDNPETANVTDTYVSRQTANKNVTGLTVVDGAATTVKKIYGSTVASENLIALPYSFTTYAINGITFTAQSDGGIKVQGTATATAVRDLNKTPLFGYNLASSNGKAYTMGGFTISGGKDDVIFAIDAGSGKAYVYVETGKTVDTVIYPMFQYGTDTSAAATAYRPYFSGLKNAYFKGIRSTGKNLFDISVIENTTHVINNGDGTISVNNYPANTGKTLAQLCPNMRAGETYTLRLSTEASGSSLIYLWGIGVWFDGQPRTITEEDLNSNVGFYGYHPDSENKGKACKISNIRIGYDTTTYEPYKADESFMLNEAVPLGEWDYIDTETKKIYPRTKIITLDGSEIWIVTNSASLTGTSKYSYKTSLAVPGKGVGYGSSLVIHEKRADIKEMGTTGGAATTAWGIIEMYTNTLATVEEVKAYFTNNPLDCAYQLKTTKSDDLALPTDNYSSFDGGSETVIQGTVDNSADGAILSVTQTYSIHENPTEAATKAYVNNGLAKKLDKTGGTITGSLIVEKGADTTLSALVVKNGDVAYGLTYDSRDEAYKLGQGAVDEKGDFSFAEGEGAPIALRDDSTAFTDGHIVAWSEEGNKFVDSGKSIDGIPDINDLERRIAIQEIYQRTDCLGEVYEMYENNQLEVSDIDNFYVGMSLIFTDIEDYHIPEVSGRVVIAVDKDKRRITVDGSDITDLMPAGGKIYVHESDSALHSIKQKLSEFETNFDNIEEHFDNVVNLNGTQTIYGGKTFQNTVFVKGGIDARDDNDNTVIYDADGIDYHGVVWSGRLKFPLKYSGVYIIATTDDIDTAIGDINSILDAINGEVI